MYSLIGMPYELGADGSNGTIDCIHLVYAVLAKLNIPHPSFNQEWYVSDWRVVSKELAKWGYRIDKPSYDGDVVLLPHQSFAFGVAWQKGILCTCPHLAAVNWFPMDKVPVRRAYRSAFFPMSAN